MLKIYSVAEYAKEYYHSPRQVYRLIRERKIRARKIRSRWVIMAPAKTK